ncbi:hypothetical protein Glove_80g12 [Diversispora epigaea]|uniref:Uncharacterized protein n=1 Tax=Diversispora epigaea TaxID=1348612 RepID=A0A397JEY0_9GLOM|nr:hypothetical protein Glove_80g12 [Diversispora epigaea]
MLTIKSSENTELRNENTELRNENAKLRQDIEGHETRITKLEQGEKSITNVSQSSVNSNDTPEQIVSRCDDTPVSDISDNISNSNKSNNLPALDISVDTSNSGNTPDLSSEPILAQSKLPEDIIDDDTAETLDFVERKYKERVSEEIMERIKEKKLRDQNLSSSEEVVPEISAGGPCQNTHRKKGAEKIVQLIADGIQDDAQSGVEITLCDEIPAGSPCQDSSTVPLFSLAQLFDKATDAEYGAIRANQEEILRWYYYGEGFLIQVRVVIQDGNGKIGEKKAKGIVYDKILEYLSILRKKRSEDTGLQLPEISRKYLQGKTQKAVKIYKLFENLGTYKIKYITTYSANSISELTNDKIQEIIDSFTKQESHHMIQKDESSTPEISAGAPCQNSEDMISEEVKSLPETEISISTESHVSDSSSSKLSQENNPEISHKVSRSAEVSVSSNPIHDHVYFRNKTLLRYSGLYKTIITEKNDYYGIIEGSLCPMCKQSHEDGKSVKGRYEAGSYFIKCGKHEIEIV